MSDLVLYDFRRNQGQGHGHKFMSDLPIAEVRNKKMKSAINA